MGSEMCIRDRLRVGRLCCPRDDLGIEAGVVREQGHLMDEAVNTLLGSCVSGGVTKVTAGTVHCSIICASSSAAAATLTLLNYDSLLLAARGYE